MLRQVGGWRTRSSALLWGPLRDPVRATLHSRSEHGEGPPAMTGQGTPLQGVPSVPGRGSGAGPPCTRGPVLQDHCSGGFRPREVMWGRSVPEVLP